MQAPCVCGVFFFLFFCWFRAFVRLCVCLEGIYWEGGTIFTFFVHPFHLPIAFIIHPPLPIVYYYYTLVLHLVFSIKRGGLLSQRVGGGLTLLATLPLRTLLATLPLRKTSGKRLKGIWRPKYSFMRFLFISLATAAFAINDQLCPDQPSDAWAQVRCNSTISSCSKNGFSRGNGWGCCPYPNATSCPSGYQCCPSGTQCNLISGSGYGAVYTCVGGGGAPSSISKCPCKPGADIAPSTTLKNLLVIGDSLSIGYTPPLAQNLSDIAQVVHAPWDTSDGGAEESAYLDQCLETFLTSPSGETWYPDVILFNSGMHNLADPSSTPGHGITPGQGDTYTNYLGYLANATARLVAFAAGSGGKTRLVYTLTTPYLCTLATDTIINATLNVQAETLMRSYGIPTLDPHTAIVNKCGAAPVQSCFGQTGCWCPHCPAGYSWLANTVLAPPIRAILTMQ